MSLKILAVFAVALIVVAGAVIYFTSPRVLAQGEYDQFAQCLTEKGAVFYGAFWCPHCQRQKDELGASMQYVNYVECSTPDRRQTAECNAAGITGYPTWEFADGSRLNGYVPPQQLAEKTGCQFKKDSQLSKNST